MGRNTLEFEDDWEAWKFLASRGYEHRGGVIRFRPEKLNDMPDDEANAIDYLFGEWDWAYDYWPEDKG